MRVEHKAWSRGREAAGLCRVHLEGMTSAERRGRLPMHTTRRTTCTQPRNGNNARARTWPASGCISGAGTSIGSARSGSWRGNYGSRCNELPIHPQRDVPGQAGAAARHGALRQPDCSQTGGAVDGPAAGIDYRSEEKDMSDAKWTPGPWSLTEQRCEGERTILIRRQWGGEFEPGAEGSDTYGSCLGAHIADIKHQGHDAPVVTRA